MKALGSLSEKIPCRSPGRERTPEPASLMVPASGAPEMPVDAHFGSPECQILLSSSCFVSEYTEFIFSSKHHTVPNGSPE